jgi:hypothetical protein
VGVRFQVSFNPFLRELFTFPLRYLCTIGHLVYLALPEGAGSFTRTTTESVLLRIPSPHFPLRVRGYHPLWRRVPAVFHFGSVWACEGPTTPQDLRPRGLGSSPFARHYSGNTCWYLFLRVLRCFTSPGSPPFRDTLQSRVGCPIRESWDHSLLAAPPGLSQLATPFIATRCQGIPRTPLPL